eukprot:CAMPEP_0113310284 /NCGR_PEP_ID=MMETSP0010_2-20120614/7991_1 /TAXON_ID=216773 ORGANISM="Corethron hystrix, Strain 308" /NCGR_SAMPLE_ID=MMETSP0010_2 /ASSEMBLY_ACC=CAM_ASM_000155 /LENGTH=244 /DNA_ID=CAMNT_0000165709 /DNA_START=205 /DNA_END=936 /DNA_ORIENTATION=- /assembly_acc=CAM_ASM_000155
MLVPPYLKRKEIESSKLQYLGVAAAITSRLQLPQLLDDLPAVPRHPTLHVLEHPAHRPVGSDDVRLPIAERPEPRHRQGGVVPFADLPPEVREHKEVQVLRGAELRVLLHRVHAHPDDLGVEGPVRVLIALEAPRLQGAPGGEGAGIEIEDGPFLFRRQVPEGGVAFSGAAGQVEVRGRRAEHVGDLRRGEGGGRTEEVRAGERAEGDGARREKRSAGGGGRGEGGGGGRSSGEGSGGGGSGEG